MKTGLTAALATLFLIGCGDGGGGSKSSDGGVVADSGSGGSSTTDVEFLSFYLPSGTLNRPYATTLRAMGGVAPYTFGVYQNLLPPGLSLNAQTGVISGTPLALGTYTFFLSAIDTTGILEVKYFGITVGDDFLSKGAGWHAVSSGTTAPLFSVDFVDAANGWFVGWAGTIRRTTTGGVMFDDAYGHPNYVNWGQTILPADPTGNVQASQPASGMYQFTKVDAVSGNVAWVGTKGGTVKGYSDSVGTTMSHVLRTTDGAASWDRIITTNGQYAAGLQAFNAGDAKVATRQEDGANSNFLAIGGGTNLWHVSMPTAALTDLAFLNANTGIVVGNGISRTTNGGASWTAVHGSSTLYRAATWVDSSTVIVVGDAGKILRSTNGGIAWALVATAASDFYDVSFSGQTGWAVGLNGLIARSTNGGLTWMLESSGTSQHLYGISAVNGTTAWAVGANGTVVKRQ